MMKRLALALSMLLAETAFAPFRSTVIVEWQMPAGSVIPDAYVLHATNDLSVPLTNWPVYTTFVEPLAGQSNVFLFALSVTNRVTLPVTPGMMFYYLTSSNIWGETGPSQVAWTPPLPQQPARTTIR